MYNTLYFSLQVLTDLQASTRDEIDSEKGGGDGVGVGGLSGGVEADEGASTMSGPTDNPIPLSSPSARHSTASTLSSSWDSTTSMPASSGENAGVKDEVKVTVAPSQPLKGDASTGVLKLKTVWFNFAAPPPISIKKKMDFTRSVCKCLQSVVHSTVLGVWLSRCLTIQSISNTWHANNAQHFKW